MSKYKIKARPQITNSKGMIHRHIEFISQREDKTKYVQTITCQITPDGIFQINKNGAKVEVLDE